MVTINNAQGIPINEHQLKQDTEKILSYLGYENFDLGILLCDNPTMQKYNKQYRKKDKSTDILSFPFYPELKAGEQINASSDEEQNLGDLVLCPAYIKEDLVRWDQDFETRMKVLLVHGVCHLLGYDHIEDEDYIIMDTKEKELLKILN